MSPCEYKKCPIPDTSNEVKLPCAGTGCQKSLHMSCLTVFLQRVKWCDTELLGSNAVCSKTCYNKFASSASRKKTWTNDGMNGVDDPNTSEKILLDWLTTEGNYTNKWRGKNNNGKKKKHVAAEIALLMNAANVTVKRDHKQVMNKIAHIEKSFRIAHDFANTETGQGLQENDKGEFDDAVTKKCQYYFDLLEIFGDRASAKPKVTSADNLDSSEEDDDEEESDEESEEELDDDDDNPDSIDLERMDISFDTVNDDSMNDTIIVTDPSIIQLNENKSGNKKQKTKRVRSSVSLAGSAASSKRSKTSKVSLLTDSASAKFESLSVAQEKLANAKIDVANKQAISQKLQNEQIELQLRMQKFEMLQNIRRQRPDMTNDQIVAMFPSLSEFVEYI